MRTYSPLIEIGIYSGLGGCNFESFERLLSDVDRREEKNLCKIIIKTNFPRGNPCSDLNKNYLSRQT